MTQTLASEKCRRMGSNTNIMSAGALKSITQEIGSKKMIRGPSIQAAPTKQMVAEIQPMMGFELNF